MQFKQSIPNNFLAILKDSPYAMDMTKNPLRDRFTQNTPQATTTNPEPTIRDTIIFMRECHEGQTDHSGAKYEAHPYRVAMNLIRLFPNAPAYAIKAILLHDTIEDCKDKGINENALSQKGFHNFTVTIVNLLTKPDDDTRRYNEVIDDLIASGNFWAIAGKLADNMDNMHPERVEELRQINPEKVEYFDQKYTGSIIKLCGALGLDHSNVMNLIQNSRPLLKESEEFLDSDYFVELINCSEENNAANINSPINSPSVK